MDTGDALEVPAAADEPGGEKLLRSRVQDELVDCAREEGGENARLVPDTALLADRSRRGIGRRGAQEEHRQVNAQYVI